MKNVLIGMLVIGGIAFLVVLLSPMMSGLHDFRTNELDNSFTVTTNATTSGGNVTLTHELFNGDTQFASVASNLTNDVPLANSYVQSTRALEVTGLIPSGNRTVTVTFDTGALDATTENVAKVSPTAFVFGIIALVIIVVALLVMGLKRR